MRNSGLERWSPPPAEQGLPECWPPGPPRPFRFLHAAGLALLLSAPIHTALHRLLTQAEGPFFSDLWLGAAIALLPIGVMTALAAAFFRGIEPGIDGLSARDFAIYTFWIAFSAIPLHLVFRPLFDFTTGAGA